MAGTIRKRGASWQALLSYIDPDTKKQVQFSATCKTESDAQRALAELIDKRDRGRLVRQNETVQQLADRWYEHVVSSGGVAANTLVKYAAFVRPDGREMTALGRLRVVEVTAYHVDLLMASASDLAANTRISMMNRLTSMFGQAVKWGWRDTNPCKQARKAKKPSTELNLPTDIERGRLLAAADEDGLFSGTFVRLALTTGMRHGEIAGLQWRDIAWDTGIINVDRQTSRNGSAGPKGSTPGTTKTRTVKIGADMLAQLKTWREQQELVWVERFRQPALSGDAWVFAARPTSSGSSMYEKIGTRWAIVRASAGLPKMRLHDCRHLAATMMLQAKMPPQVVAKRLGHANANITLAVYAQVLPDDDDRAAEMLDRLI